MTFKAGVALCTTMFQTLQTRAGWHYAGKHIYPGIEMWETLEREARDLNYDITRKDFPIYIEINPRVRAIFARLLRDAANAIERGHD